MAAPSRAVNLTAMPTQGNRFPRRTDTSSEDPNERSAPMTTDLTGQTALVTGGNSGIGRATAIDLAAHGAHVILTGRDQARGDQVVATIREADGTADFVASTLDREASARDLARRAVELGGGHVDVLVNNAGVFPFGPTDQATEADFDSVFAVNVKVPFFLVAELAPASTGRSGSSSSRPAAVDAPRPRRGLPTRR